MKTTLKTMAIIAIVLGGLAVIGSAEGGSGAGYAFIGGLFFIAEGIVALMYIKEVSKN